MAAVARAVFGYIFLVLMVRIVGRRPGKQMTPLEFVFVFFNGGLTLTFLVGNDMSVTNALLQIVVVTMLHSVIARLKWRYPSVGRMLDGTPLVLLDQGRWKAETMEQMGMQEEDVLAAARDKGLERADEIQYAVLERNGEISIIEVPRRS